MVRILYNQSQCSSDFWDSFIHHLEFLAQNSEDPEFTLSNVSYINIDSYSENGITNLLQYDKTDLIDENGNPPPANFILEEGIYKISFNVNNGKTFHFFLPVKNKCNNNLPLSSYVSMLPFPVPILDQNLQLNIKCAANLDFQIEVIDPTAQIIFSNSYAVKSGHDENHKITLPQNAPTGILIVKLRLRDGSQKTSIITKNT